MKLRGMPVFLCIVTLLTAAQPDLHCLVYTAPMRDAGRQTIDRQREFQQFKMGLAKGVIKRSASPASSNPRANFIYEYVFRSIEADRIPVARPTNDYEFLRRVMLDLTGRIPTLQRQRPHA